MTLLQRIYKLEDEKLDLLMKGAEFNPHLMDKIYSIDEKLNKLYSWLSNGYMNGVME